MFIIIFSVFPLTKCHHYHFHDVEASFPYFCLGWSPYKHCPRSDTPPPIAASTSWDQRTSGWSPPSATPSLPARAPRPATSLRWHHRYQNYHFQRHSGLEHHHHVCQQKFSDIYLDLLQFTLVFLNLPWFTSTYLDIHWFTSIYLHFPWLTSIYVDLPQFVLIYLNSPQD